MADEQRADRQPAPLDELLGRKDLDVESGCLAFTHMFLDLLAQRRIAADVFLNGTREVAKESALIVGFLRQSEDAAELSLSPQILPQCFQRLLLPRMGDTGVIEGLFVKLPGAVRVRIMTRSRKVL